VPFLTMLAVSRIDGSVGNPADHSRSEREMLWVRVPPEPLKDCPSGPAVVAATLSQWRSWVRIPPRMLVASAGQWRAQVAVTHPLSLCRFNSCPTHLWPVRRLVMPPAFQAGQVGSKPTRVASTDPGSSNR
jgi:hypothetical protein